MQISKVDTHGDLRKTGYKIAGIIWQLQQHFEVNQDRVVGLDNALSNLSIDPQNGKNKRKKDLKVLVDPIWVPVDRIGGCGRGCRCSRHCGRGWGLGRWSRSLGCKLRWRRRSANLLPLLLILIAVNLTLHQAVVTHHHHLCWGQSSRQLGMWAQLEPSSSKWP